MHYDSVFVDTAQAKAEMFSHYFCSVRSECGPFIVAIAQSDESGLNVIEVSEEEVYRVLMKLNPNQAMGLDEIGL